MIVNHQLFNYLDRLFITHGPSIKNQENPHENIIPLNILGLWGVYGLIEDYNTQDDLWNQYPHDQLMMVSHLMANHLIVHLLQWVATYNPIYYYPYKKYFNNYCYYQYRKSIINLKHPENWQKYPHDYGLRVGQKINGGPLGNYYWKHNICKKPQSLSMEKIQL